MHWREAGLPENFQILDADDQQRLLRRMIREEGYDENQWPARQAQWFINARKDEGQRPAAIETLDNPLTETWTQIDPLSMSEGIVNALRNPASGESLKRAIRPFSEKAVIDRHFELLEVEDCSTKQG